jgi:hypothetical protein
MSDDRPQHSGGFSGSLSVVRAAAVLVAFVVGVAILVAVGTRPTVTSPSSSAQTTLPPVSTTTTAPGGGSTTSTSAGGASTTSTTRAGHHHGGTTTPTTNVSPATVSVVVANGTSTAGLAAHYTTVLGTGGWHVGTPTDSATSEATSAVYYAAGMQKAATDVANALGVKHSEVLPLTTATPVAGVAGTDVVVVVGQDLANPAGGS